MLACGRPKNLKRKTVFRSTMENDPRKEGRPMLEPRARKFVKVSENIWKFGWNIKVREGFVCKDFMRSPKIGLSLSTVRGNDS